MTKKLYNILLDSNKIGTTELEHADAPMGIVFGQINFIDINSGYDFFKSYCLTNEIDIMTDYQEDRLITTACLPNIQIVDRNGLEIKGLGTYVNGMDSDMYYVYVVGILYPFHETEFPHHVKAYHDKFNKE